ncbi:adenosylcobyric acid synthase [Thermosulfidibacter takaii ABI70S6]|uniref:Cobyric acid synthase n=1 Tax=Thermosulfidibacter takaii (strain DSM 17441 / JCM 13301 / NBRC 103674 / ABI70S6) TaxID=1298851 RepID=A0A0S3QVI3_THET7|nr:cobyric acid synthase [Thermosulfidibacter takaii]BAT72335.1 adenosylcobyric acid synthase [Thermosulfidibacter takaii ABI70S6]
MRGKLLVILGTSSGAGKSFVTTAICAFYKRWGLKVAPFKAQNMSLNAVAALDGEMAWAQFVQALACGQEPTVKFNPVLLKPVGNAKSEVIVLGKSKGYVESFQFDDYRRAVKPFAYEVLSDLLEEYDVVVVEGAGSPVEINIKEHDFSNIAISTHFKAPALLVADIDRGGVFAQIVGTYELLSEEERRFLKGIIINRFRGYEEILRPGIDFIEDRLKVPVLAVLPYLENVLPPEDSLDVRGKPGRPLIGVVRYPKMSNFSDFVPFFVEKVGIKFCTSPEELEDVDAIILPGSRTVLSDLRWLKQKGIDQKILEKARLVPVIGICGGYHMLGRELFDPYGKEGGGKEEGLGLLSIKVFYEGEKKVEKVGAILCQDLWGIKGGIKGYLMHSGKVDVKEGEWLFRIGDNFDGCVNRNIIGTHLHNLFWNDGLRSEFIRYLKGKPTGKSYLQELNKVFNNLAELIENYPKLMQFLKQIVSN